MAWWPWWCCTGIWRNTSYSEKYTDWQCMCVHLACQEEFTNIDVEYCCLPGWKCSTEHVRQFADLPSNAQSYVRKIEQLTGVPGQPVISLFPLLCLSWTPGRWNSRRTDNLAKTHFLINLASISNTWKNRDHRYIFWAAVKQMIKVLNLCMSLVLVHYCYYLKFSLV